MPYIVSPFSEYGYHFHEITDGNWNKHVPVAGEQMDVDRTPVNDLNDDPIGDGDAFAMTPTPDMDIGNVPHHGSTHVANYGWIINGADRVNVGWKGPTPAWVTQSFDSPTRVIVTPDGVDLGVQSDGRRVLACAYDHGFSVLVDNVLISQKIMWLEVYGGVVSIMTTPPKPPTGARARKTRLSGFYNVFGDEDDDDADDVCGLDVLGAGQVGPKRSVLPKLPSLSLFRRKGIGKPLTDDKAAKLHPMHAAPNAYRSAVQAARSGANAIKVSGRRFQTVVHGDCGKGSVLVGATPGNKPAVGKKLTAKQKAAVDRYNSAAKKALSAGVAAKKSGSKAINVAKQTLNTIATSSAAVRALLSKPPTMMHGQDPAPVPDPTNPGYLTDGSPDPNASAAGSPIALPNPPPDVPPTPAPSLDTPIDHVPPDGVPYEGKKGWPSYAFGSYSYFTGPQGQNGGKWGFVWGWNHMNSPSSKDARWIMRHGQDRFGTDNWDDWGSVAGDPGQVALYSRQGLKQDGGGGGDGVDKDGYNGPKWGPLIGNPSMSDFANLRFAEADKKWFWYLNEAPDWSTAELRYAAAKVKADQDAADKAAADADAKAAAKQAADIAAAQAQQDASNALAESAAASEASVAETQRQSQYSQLELDAAKAQQDLQIQQAQYQFQTQQTQQDQEAAQADEGDSGGFGESNPADRTSPDPGLPSVLPDAGNSAIPFSEATFDQAEEAGKQQDTFADVTE